MRSDVWAAVAALASTQHGLISTRQLRTAGASRHAIARAVASGLLQHSRRGVHLVNGVPASPWQPLMAACLAAGDGVVASHRAAAALHQFPGILPHHIELTSAKSGLRLDGVRCHRAQLLKHHCTSVLNIACTTAERTIVDIARIVHPTLLSTIVDHSERRGICQPDSVAACLDEIGSRGRPGAKVLRAILSDRVGGDSPLETNWLRILKKAELVPPALQHQVVVQGRVFLLDMAWPRHMIGIEVDGWEPHRTRGALDHGARRGNLLLEAGWRIVHVTSRTPASQVIRQLRAFIAE